jgi:hypothetical protein
MRKVLNIDEWYNSIEKASVEVHEAYGGNMSDFRYEYPVKFEEVTGNSEKAIKKISKAGKGYEVRTSIYMSKNELEAVGKEMGLELISYEKSSSVVVAVYESAVNEAKYPVSQWKWDAKHPYSFKIYLKNGDKHNTDFYDLESAKKMKQVLDKDKETYVIHKSNDGQFNDEVRDLMRESVNEGYVPSNIKDFAKRKGITSLVNTVAGWVEKVGKRISGGTAIGKDYGTLILDIKYQDSAIRINVEDETVELYDEPVSNLKEFKQVYNEYQTEDMNEARSINKIQKDWGKITADMKDTVDMWKAAEGKDKEDLLAKLKDLTAQKKKLEAELNDAVGLKDADAELVGESFNPIESVVESYDELNERHITLKRKYTENYPAKTAGKTAIVRNKMLDAIADGRLTQEQFDALLSEFSADGKRWMKANAQYFNVSEDGVALSKFGKRALAQLPAKPQASVNETKQIENKPMRFIYESFESFINEARETYVCYWKEGTMKMHFYSEHTSMKSAEKMMEIMLKTNALHTKDGVGIMPKSEWDRLEVDGYAFNEGLVTEAFQSSKLASLLNLSGFNSRTMKALYNYTKVKLDQITDDQIVELHPMEAYKSKVKGIYFYILDNPKDNPYATSKYVRQLSGNTLLAVATGSNDFLGITYSRYWSKNGQDINMSSTNSASDTIGVDKRYSGYEASGLYNVKRIAEVADRVLMFNPDILPSTLDMRRERNAAKAGATAFMSDKDFKAENTKRYREILQTRAMNDDIDGMVENAVNELADQIKTATKKMEMGRYGDLLIGTSPKGQEVKLRDASNHMANILDSYSRYVEYVNKLKKEPESGSYYKKEAAVYAKDVKDRVSKISNLDYAW